MRRILIFAPAWVGDMVMAESLVAALKRAEPDSSIHLLAPPWTAPLGERMAGIAKVHRIDAAHGRFDLMARIRLGRSLGPEKFDLAIVLPGSFKAAIVPFFAGVPTRRGYRGEMRYGLLNDIRVLDKEALPRTIDRFVALAAEPGDPLPLVTPPVLRHDTDAARAIAGRLGLAGEARPIIGLCPGAEYGPAKQWPATHYAALAEMLHRQGYAVWIFGSGKDRIVAEDIGILAVEKNPDAVPVNLCGRTSLLEAIDLMGLTSGIVTNDSGLMHVAAAIGRPLVALYGSTTPAMTPPMTDEARIMERTLSCRPCFKRECPLGHLNCLKLIEAGEVKEALMPLVAPPPPPAFH